MGERTGHGVNGRGSGHGPAGRRGPRTAVLAVIGAAALLALAACGPAQAAGGAISPAAAVGSAAGSGTAPSSAAPSTSHVSVPALPTTTPTGATDPAGSTDPTSTDPSTSTTPTPTHIAAPPAHITTDLAAGQHPNPVTPITVHATGGTLRSVTLTNPAEHVTVRGTLAADHLSWKSAQVLGYAKDYRLTATAVNADGAPTTVHKDFTTLAPANQTMAYFQTTGGNPLIDGATFGVGVILSVHFDEPITDQAAAQKALHVTTTPHVAGSWNWVDNQDVHFRPESFYKAGTKVTVAADIYGVRVGPGLYGQSDASTSFTIGRRQITYAYDNAPNAVDKVVVKNGDGQVLRTMNTSMGAHGGETWKGTYINFYTMGGTYVVIDHENPAIMSSASYGLPADAPGGYKPEPIPWSTRISNGGIYLHELNSTIWAQNSGQDVSHGCLNLDTANAKWFFQNSLVGDPVIVKGAKGAPEIQLWQGGDWSVPWSTWVKGSALH